MIHDEALQYVNYGLAWTLARCQSVRLATKERQDAPADREAGGGRFLGGRLSIGREHSSPARSVERAALYHHPWRRLPSSSNRLSMRSIMRVREFRGTEFNRLTTADSARFVNNASIL
jgi:hypothetical protein